MTGKVARTTGTAPRSPAQASTVCSRPLKPPNAVATKVAIGRATRTRTKRQQDPVDGDVVELGGEDEQAEDEEHRHLRDPGQPLVEDRH